jgi:hypothetical protein
MVSGAMPFFARSALISLSTWFAMDEFVFVTVPEEVLPVGALEVPALPEAEGLDAELWLPDVDLQEFALQAAVTQPEGLHAILLHICVPQKAVLQGILPPPNSE